MYIHIMSYVYIHIYIYIYVYTHITSCIWMAPAVLARAEQPCGRRYVLLLLLCIYIYIYKLIHSFMYFTYLM